MGVHGLWKLLEPAGKPVPVETLENKVLAVDVSIWLHQATRGFQDARGQALPNAHLLGLFHRLCKLLFWRVRPVFVFDGGAPLLKQQTVAARRRRREDAQERAERSRRRLLELHLRKHAVAEVLRARAARGEGAGEGEGGRARPLPPLLLPASAQAPADDMFVLPPPPPRSPVRSERGDDEASSSGDEAEAEAEEEGAQTAASPRRGRAHSHLRLAGLDLHSVDVRSAEFLALPADVRHEILTELKETRKQSSWGRLHEMPRESVDFSSYQMTRLLKRRSVQQSLEEVEKEMGGRSMSLAELEELMGETGALAAAMPGRRVAADPSTRYIFLTGGGDGAEVAKSQDVKAETTDGESLKTEQDNVSQLGLISQIKPVDVKNEYFEEFSDECAEWFPEFEFADATGSDDLVGRQLKAAHNFIFENSGLTQEQILAVIKDHSSNKSSLLDQPSTSKASCSKDMDQSTLKEDGNLSFNKKEIIASTSVCSVFDLPSTSKDVICYSEEKHEDRSTAKNKDSLVSSHIANSSPESSALCKLEKNEIKVQLVKDVCAPHVKEALKINDQTSSKELMPCSELLAASPSAETSEKNVLLENNTCQLPCNSNNIPFTSKTKEDIGRITNSVNRHSPLHAPLKTNDSGVEEKDICSSDEDLIEVSDSVKIVSGVAQQLSVNPASLQVVIQPTLTDLSEDIFSDIFEGPTVKQPQLENNSSLLKGHSISKEVNISDLHSNSACDKISIVETSQQQKEDFQNEMDNSERQETSPISCVSNSDAVLLISDNGSEESEVEITEEAVASKGNEDDIPARKTSALTTEQLEKLEGSLQEEGSRLQKAQAREERLAASITEQMVQDAQELLQLFGVPYVVAPMEAEAQCAFLDRASLTDGTITDDSDIWLFGGQKVYKNFFDQKKHVLQFRDIDIFHYFKLSRSQLVLLALLVGSDYTTGLTGVGPVTALEILAAFPSSSKQGPPEQIVEGLRSFREWYSSGKEGKWDKAKLRNKLKDLELSRDFPSISVVEAYLSPKVDESLEKFSWGSPDIESIKEFARVKFGWPTSKTHEILQPIMKKLNIKITQLSIQTYFQAKPNLSSAASGLSKRVQEAIERIDAVQGSSSEDDPSPAKKKKSVISPKNVKRGNSHDIIANFNKTKRKEVPSVMKIGRSRGTKKTKQGIDSSNIQEPPVLVPSTSMPAPSTSVKNINKSFVVAPSKKGEFILQREKDKLNMLKNKLKAIEIYRKSARGLDKTKRDKKKKREILSQANLSESSSSSDEM